MNYQRQKLNMIQERMEKFQSLMNNKSLSEKERKDAAGNYYFYKLKWYECEIPPISEKVKGEDHETLA
ncbi:MAG TPA: hypothetical protein VMV95_02435 [Bacillota bacterium]|nr:hypothetical protein [Bacillota bacterium]